MSVIKVPTLLVMDFETGGFDAKTNAVTEFAGIALNGSTFEEVGRYEAMIAPYSDELLYNPDALKATNISMEMIKTGVDFKTFTKDFFSFLKRTNIYGTTRKYKTIICGHNITFDIQFLHQLFFLAGKRMEDYFMGDYDYFGNFQPKYIDTLPLAQYKWGDDEGMVKHTLGECVTKTGEEMVNAHRAMNDVMANKGLIINFLNSLRNKGTELMTDTEEQQYRFRDKFKF